MSLIRLRVASTMILAVAALSASALSTLALTEGLARAAPSTWSIVHSANPSKSMSSLADVSCTTSTDCVAVGLERDHGEQTLVETWNGSTWTVVPSQNPSPRNILKGVSCSGTMSCVAVGSSWSGASGSPTASLVESFNGTSWSVVPSPAPSSFSQLSSVSCASPTFCVGVGSYGTSYGAASNTLVETWDGTSWTITPSSNGPDSSDDQFYRVSCASPTSCMAVGSDVTTNREQTLVETWNGTSWIVTSGPIANAVFFGVSCSSATFCVAVGLDAGKTIIESWNGTSLTVIPSPNPAKYRDLLGAVSCTSTTNCVSTGWFLHEGGPVQTLVESWDGTSWSMTPSVTRSTSSYLNGGDSCVDSMNCEAVGYSTSAAGVTKTLVLDGSSP